MNPDPLALHDADDPEADLNLYAYVGGEVFSAVDPEGLQSRPPPSGRGRRDLPGSRPSVPTLTFPTRASIGRSSRSGGFTTGLPLRPVTVQGVRLNPTFDRAPAGTRIVERNFWGSYVVEAQTTGGLARYHIGSLPSSRAGRTRPIEIPTVDATYHALSRIAAQARDAWDPSYLSTSSVTAIRNAQREGRSGDAIVHYLQMRGQWIHGAVRDAARISPETQNLRYNSVGVDFTNGRSGGVTGYELMSNSAKASVTHSTKLSNQTYGEVRYDATLRQSERAWLFRGEGK